MWRSQFVCEVGMNRWQALVDVVESFNSRGRSGMALCAVLVIVAIPALCWLCAGIWGIKLSH